MQSILRRRFLLALLQWKRYTPGVAPGRAVMAKALSRYRTRDMIRVVACQRGMAP
jgi:hypothetical protein